MTFFSDDIGDIFVNQSIEAKDKDVSGEEITGMSKDLELMCSVLKTLARDWSEDGQKEREQSYQLILNEIERVYSHLNYAQKKETAILVPGAGLGRLAYEIALRGYISRGNDFSLYMLIASNFVLNKSRERNCYTIHPWIHQHSNNLSAQDQLWPVKFPDINPANVPPDFNFTMIAGDFLEVYSDDKYLSSQDCVVTCFFIDCAHNVIDFLEQIHRVLKTGGKWINFGPLLYHFADSTHESSIEPSYDILHNMIEQVGFEFLREETDLKSMYCNNEKSMFQFDYTCVFFTAKKK